MNDGLNIVCHDQDIVVVEKQSGLLSVPGRGPEKQDCVVNRALKHFPDIDIQPAVHRLDMQTSGLMVLAKNKRAHRFLSNLFQQGSVVKRYIAMVEEEIHATSGTIDLAFRLDPDNRPYQVYDPINGKRGITLWRKIGSHHSGTRVEFTPLTGRTHQLRLHAAHHLGLDAAIIGDALYGSGQDGDVMLLHATYLSFNHPANSRICEFFSSPSF